MKDLESVFKFVRGASIFDVFIISFLLLPFVFDAWVQVFKELGYQPAQMSISLIGIFTAYLICIVVMLIGAHRARKAEVAKAQVIGYLQANDYTMMSFDRVREKINSTYTDAFLEKTIESFPNDLRRAKLKGAKRGIARILEETEAKQDA